MCWNDCGSEDISHSNARRSNMDVSDASCRIQDGKSIPSSKRKEESPDKSISGLVATIPAESKMVKATAALLGDVKPR